MPALPTVPLPVDDRQRRRPDIGTRHAARIAHRWDADREGSAARTSPEKACAAQMRSTREVLGLAVAALDVHVGLECAHQRQRFVFVVQPHRRHGRQGADDPRTVDRVVERPAGPFGQTPRRSVGLDTNHQRTPMAACFREAGHMTGMQDVEYAVGEHQGTRQLGAQARQQGGSTVSSSAPL